VTGETASQIQFTDTMGTRLPIVIAGRGGHGVLPHWLDRVVPHIEA